MNKKFKEKIYAYYNFIKKEINNEEEVKEFFLNSICSLFYKQKEKIFSKSSHLVFHFISLISEEDESYIINKTNLSPSETFKTAATFKDKNTLVNYLEEFIYNCELSRDIIYPYLKNLNIEESPYKVTEGPIISKIKTSIIIFLILLFIILLSIYLLPVLLGLIFAYFALPLHLLFYRMIQKNTFLTKLLMVITSPFSLISNVFSRKKTETKKDNNMANLKNAGHFTLVTIITIVIFIIFILSILLKSSFDKTKIENDKIEIGDKLSNTLNYLKTLSFIKNAITYFEKEVIYILDNPEEIIKNFLSKKHNQIKTKDYVWGSVSVLTSFLIYSVLTSFFFIFFINKIAYFNIKARDTENSSIGNYLVKSIISSSWLPTISQKNQQQATIITEEIFNRIRIWAKSYFLIIVIESIFYITVFYMLKIPYAVILGLIAGLTILLPIIGPIISCFITLIVCIIYAPHLIFIVIGIYIAMNLIIEQFFLYPYYVGNSLGLTILETVVVIFIGGLVANITGMILAIPVASVMKYLFPLVYKKKND